MKSNAELICMYAGESKTIQLEGHQILGRPSKKSNPDISLPVGTVSRTHGEFITEDDTCFYRDLGGTNGTIYNGKMLKQGAIRVLKDGDTLRIHGAEDPDRIMDVEMVFREKRAEAIPDQEKSVYGWDNRLNPYGSAATGKPAAATVEKPAVAEMPVAADMPVAAEMPAAADMPVAAEMPAAADMPVAAEMPVAATVEKPVAAEMPEAAEMPAATEKPETAAAKKYPDNQAKVPKHASAFSGSGLDVHIQDRTVGRRGKEFAILRDINFSIPNGSMVLILGGSGAGKTTLVNAIMGYEKANGTILYNDTDIYEEYEKMKYEIGYVPQQDLLRMTDTVYDTLLNAAYMRLPAGQPDQYYIDKALTTMEMLGLKREKDSMIRKLSGGQRKRLSIAVEYVGNPSLFFLDEPDSGLDGVMARELMNNLRTIANEGKIVIVITHSPDRAFELFDSVVVLAKDTRDNCGHLVFQGHPTEACRFFDAKDFESIVRKINREDEGGEGLAEYFIEKYEKKGGAVS